MGTRTFTPDVRPRVIALVKAGTSLSEVARQERIARNTVERWARAAGVKPRAWGQRHSPESDAKLATMLAAGAKWNDIAVAVYGNLNARTEAQRRAARLELSQAKASRPSQPVVPRDRPPSALPAGHPIAVQILREAGVWK